MTSISETGHIKNVANFQDPKLRKVSDFDQKLRKVSDFDQKLRKVSDFEQKKQENNRQRCYKSRVFRIIYQNYRC